MANVLLSQRGAWVVSSSKKTRQVSQSVLGREIVWLRSVVAMVLAVMERRRPSR